MLFIEALAQTMLVLAGLGFALGFGLSKLPAVANTVRAAEARLESRSIDEDLRDL